MYLKNLNFIKTTFPLKKQFLKSAQASLILVYLVIFAGAFVRLTGSGMGCPDWPKCFGYYIPPTQEKELLFTPGKEYDKGQVIIQNESLLVAKSDFLSKNSFEPYNWEKYTKHDYADFNALHTWIEYINRICRWLKPNLGLDEVNPTSNFSLRCL